MKQFILILIALGLLMLSEAFVFLGSRAHGERQNPKALQVSSLHFYYKTDEAVRFLALKSEWQATHRDALPAATAIEMAKEAYDKASVEEPFSVWKAHGGPHPWVWSAKAHIFNTTPKAFLNVPVRVQIEAKTADWGIVPELQLTNFDNLTKTARWETLPQSKVVNLPVVAPDEDMLVPLGEFHLLQFLQTHTHQWPLALRIRLSSPYFPTQTETMTLIPDHFLLPDPFSF